MTVFDFKSFVHIGHNPFISQKKGMANAQWAQRFLSTHGFLAKTRIQQMCGTVSRSLPPPNLLLLRSIPLHGICSIDLSRKPSRHRNLSSRDAPQTLSCRHPKQRLSKYLGRCQRKERLAHLCRFCSCVDSYRSTTLRQRRLRPTTRTDRLCIGFNHDRSLPLPFSLGPLSQTQRSDQIAYPYGPAWCYPLFYLYHRGHNSRCHDPRPAYFRTDGFLYHGSWLYRFWSPLHAQPKQSVLRNPCKKKSRLSATLLPLDRSFLGVTKRSDHCSSGSQNLSNLSRSIKANQLFRRQNKSPVRLLDQQFYSSSSNHCTTLQTPMADRNLFQMDQTTSSNQSILWYFSKRGQDSNLDRHFGFCACRYHQEETQNRSPTQRNLANSQHHPFRKLVNITSTCRSSIAKRIGAVF